MAYLPIDHAYPKTRVEYIIADANVDIILHSENVKFDYEFEGLILNFLMEKTYIL